VRRVYWEPGVRVTLKRRQGLKRAVERLARFVGAERISVNE
jgi:uncharacterized protein YcaQ